MVSEEGHRLLHNKKTGVIKSTPVDGGKWEGGCYEEVPFVVEASSGSFGGFITSFIIHVLGVCCMLLLFRVLSK